MSHLDWELVLKRASRIRLLISDVDGVLTDGTITYTEEGIEIKSFSVMDGLGIKLLLDAGVEFCILSSRASSATETRARELGIKRVYQGIKDKLAAYREISSELGVQDHEIAYIGDDLVDLPVLTRVGLSITVPNGARQLRDYCHYCTKVSGGKGAVREVAEVILKGKNLWSQVLNRFIHVDSHE